MRLIDADEILKKCNGGNCWYIPRDAIEDAPTIDAEPIKHGEWKYGEGKQEGWFAVNVVTRLML